MNRTRCQRRLRRKGYTHEITTLKNPWTRIPKLILIVKAHTAHDGTAFTPKHCRRDQGLSEGDVLRPVGKHYIHNGRKPR